MNPHYWKLGYPPYTLIPSSIVYATKRDAEAAAKLENRHGSYRGRGVKPYRVDAVGKIIEEGHDA